MFVHGDTTPTMATSIAAFYFGAQVCHIEAGLRTYNKKALFPEEISRQITGRIAEYHFAPTQKSKENLLKENIDEKNIIVTGNTVIDALMQSIKLIKDTPTSKIAELNNKIGNRDVILVTGHRRENHGSRFDNICEALKSLAKDKPNILIIYPVYLNHSVLAPVTRNLKDIENILLIEPLVY